MTKMRNKLFALALLAVSSVVAFAQAPVIGLTVNATVGYQLGGNAPSTHTLCGNGTNYVDSATPCTTLTLFYQTVKVNGTSETQRPALNFSAFFTGTDSASPAQTTIDPAHVGANATCSNPASVVVDVYGRTTACTSGSTQIIQSAGTTNQGTCPTGAGSFDTCIMTVTWPVSFVDNNYQVSCTGTLASDARAAINGTIKAAASVQVVIVTEGSVAVSYVGMDCIAIHP